MRVIAQFVTGTMVFVALILMSTDTVAGVLVGLIMLIFAVLTGRHFTSRGFFDNIDE